VNILLIAYEVESFPISKLSELYLKENNQPFILNADFWTFVNNKEFYKIYEIGTNK
jgi:hypothetical protein